ncbi:hypothetical protein LCGC14_0442380 [marine sediment metagenome]|uniref:Uncharacterized protein n=1 Tax=marine sediment metagenome TaxID=412755 RepID=A0A0F9VU06_9ZZZZ
MPGAGVWLSLLAFLALAFPPFLPCAPPFSLPRSVVFAPPGVWGLAVVSLPSFGPVARSAFRAGSLRGVFPRSSSRARSGAVLVCLFSCPRRAGSFAARWAGRCGVSVSLRRWAGLWAVSVPVSVGSSRWPPSVGRVVSVVGGLRAFRLALLSSGLAF